MASFRLARMALGIAACSAAPFMIVFAGAAGCAGGGGATPGSDAAPRPIVGDPPTCGAASTCEEARLLGTIPGDSDGGSLTAQGATSTWLLARVTENESGWTGVPMRVRATLTPPPGATYELYAYGYTAERAPDGGLLTDAGSIVDCATLAARGARAGQTVGLDLTWGEALDGGSANGLEDGRTLAVEVRHVAGTCSPDARWSLVITK